MTRFHLTDLNHNPSGRVTLHGMWDSIKAGLTELGHEVTYGDYVIRRGINILFEYFTPAFARELAASGTDFIVVATEIPPQNDKPGFNGGRMDNNWAERFEGFKICAPKARAIWSNIPAPQMAWYAQFAPTAHLVYGYSEALLPPGNPPKPTHRLSFPGMITAHRESILSRFGDQVATSHNGPYRIKDEAMLTVMQRGRVTLGLRQAADWPMPSTSRLSVAFHARIPLLSEWTQIETITSQIMPVCPRGTDFVDWANGFDESPETWDRLMDDWLQEFEQIKMRDCVARALGEVGL